MTTPEARLRELAIIGARLQHERAYTHGPTAGHLPHNGLGNSRFNVCPHPDCLLVRSFVVSREEDWRDHATPMCALSKEGERHSLCDGWHRHGGEIERCQCPCHADSGVQSQTGTPMEEPLNHEGEPLHSGDDARIDAVTGIRAAVEELREGGETDWHDALGGVLEECDTLDRLLIETIARERAAVAERDALKDELAKSKADAFHQSDLVEQWREAYSTLLRDLRAMVEQLKYRMSLTAFAREVAARLSREQE